LKIIQNFSNEFLQLYISQQQKQSCDIPVSVNNDILNRFLNYSKNSNYYTAYLQQYQQTINQLANNRNENFFHVNKSYGEQIENLKDEIKIIKLFDVVVLNESFISSISSLFNSFVFILGSEL
jgi:hypothetical protein